VKILQQVADVSEGCG